MKTKLYTHEGVKYAYGFILCFFFCLMLSPLSAHGGMPDNMDCACTPGAVDEDVTPPVIVFTDPLLVGLMDGDSIYAECGNLPIFNTDDVSVTDDCDEDVNVFMIDTITEEPEDCAGEGYLKTMYCGFIATDDCGNKDTLSFYIVIEDNAAPDLFGVPSDMSIECADASDVPAPPRVSAFDTCAGTIDVDFMEMIEGEGTCEETIVRVWKAIDHCGNMVTDTQKITLFDNEAPSLIGVPDNGSIEACGENVELPMVSATDNCDEDVEVVVSQEVVSAGCPYTVEVTWTASDVCGNTASETRTFNVNDTTAPEINFENTLLEGISDGDTLYFDCSNFPLLNESDVTVIDNCDANPTIVFEDYSTEESEDCQADGYKEIFYCGWTATDACGNSTTIKFYAATVDNEAPELVGVPEDGEIEGCGAGLELPEVTAVDNCDRPISVEVSQEILSEGCPYEVAITWTASDACGNTASETRTFSVNDTTAPEINFENTLLEGIADGDTLYFDCKDFPLLNESDVTVTDNCDANPTIVFEDYSAEESDNCQADGYKAIFYCGWTATDACGNSTTIKFYAATVDNEAPELVGVPENGTIESCGGEIELPEVTAVDNCDRPISVTVSQEILSEGCPYEVAITWTASDACGNTASETRTFSVNDTTAPEINFDNTLLEGIADGDTLYFDCRNFPLLNESDVTVTDNCDASPTIVFEDYSQEESSDCQADGFKAIFYCGWTATDACGNSTTIKFYAATVDNEAPEFIGLPEDGQVFEGCPEDYTLPEVSVRDNCDRPIAFEVEEVVISENCPYEVAITWTASDACGNTTSVTRNIIYQDNTPPSFTNLPQESIDLLYADFLNYEYPVLTATDNCSSARVEAPSLIEMGDCADKKYRLRWSAFDECENEIQFVQTINIVLYEPVCSIALPEDTNFCESSIQLESTADGGDGTYTYNWTITQGTDTGYAISAGADAATPTIQTGTGAFTVQLEITSGNGCVSTCEYSNECSEQENGFFGGGSQTNRVSITPNPASESIEVYFDSYQKSEVDFEVYTLLGHKVQSQSFLAEKGRNKVKMDIRDLDAAPYILMIRNGQLPIAQKFVRLRE